MFAKLNHIAIASDQYAINSRFYEALFGLRSAKNYRPARATVVSDGRVGMNIIPRREGRTSGLDHFGFEVDNADEIIEKMKQLNMSRLPKPRQASSPYAEIRASDPDGNFFDISEHSFLEPKEKG